MEHNHILDTHIVHSSRYFNDKYTWYKHYKKYIMDIFDIVATNVNFIYPKNKINWEDIQLKRELIHILFMSSSGYLSKNA